MTARRWVVGALACATLLAAVRPGQCQPVSEEPAEMEPLNRFPRMMQEYLTARLRAIYRANHERLSRSSARRPW